MTLQSIETNDCTVKALMHAYDISYSDAHAVCAKYGREPRQGFHFLAKLARELRLIAHPSYIGLKVTRMLPYIDKGKIYLCFVDRHVFCIKYGEIKDTLDNSLKTVRKLYEVRRLD